MIKQKHAAIRRERHNKEHSIWTCIWCTCKFRFSALSRHVSRILRTRPVAILLWWWETVFSFVRWQFFICFETALKQVKIAFAPAIVIVLHFHIATKNTPRILIELVRRLYKFYLEICMNVEESQRLYIAIYRYDIFQYVNAMVRILRN